MCVCYVSGGMILHNIKKKHLKLTLQVFGAWGLAGGATDDYYITKVNTMTIILMGDSGIAYGRKFNLN